MINARFILTRHSMASKWWISRDLKPILRITPGDVNFPILELHYDENGNYVKSQVFRNRIKSIDHFLAHHQEYVEWYRFLNDCQLYTKQDSLAQRLRNAGVREEIEPF